jgi:hypothetical protein
MLEKVPIRKTVVIFAAFMFLTGFAHALEKCKSSMNAAKTQLEMHHLTDEIAFDVIHSNYYKHIPKQDLADFLCYTLPLPFVPKTLGPIDKWRYQSCQQDAATAPTQPGINIKMRLCREKFGQ